jgi:hypothetical protein
VEIATANVVVRYTCGEHRLCIETLPNGGRVNKVFEEASIPYEPRLEPGSEACEEAAKRRKNDAGTRPSVKHAKMSGWKTMHVKASVAPKGMGAESSKTVLARAPPDTHASRGTSVPQKASMSKVATTVAATVTSLRADVLRISTGVKRPAAALPPRAKGKQVKVSMKRPVAVKVDTGRVSYYAILDSVPSVESHSSSSNGSADPESVMASPPPASDVHLSPRGGGGYCYGGAHDVSRRLDFTFSAILPTIICCGDFAQLARGLPSFECADDDEQIVQCLEHVSLIVLL